MAGISQQYLYQVLVYLVRDKEFADHYFDLIPEDFFDLFEAQSRIFAALKSFRDSKGRNPKVATLVSLVFDDPPEGWKKPDPDDPELWEFFEDVEGPGEPGDKDWIQERLDNELRRIATKIALREGATLVEADEFDEAALAGFREQIEKAEALSVSTPIGVSLRENLEERIARRIREEEDKVVIPTQIGKLDTYLRDGGIPMKTINVVSARTGLGKSACLVHLANAASQTGKFPVLYVSLELSREYIEDRFDASLTDLAFEDLAHNEKYIRKKMQQWRDKFSDVVILEEVPGKFSVSALKWTLDRLRRERGFEPKMVCLDYADLMKLPGSGHNGGDKRYLQLEDLYIALRGIAVERELVIWTASQVNRAGVGGAAGTEHTSGADGKAATADVMISINRLNKKGEEDTHDPDPNKPSNVNIYVSKNRFGPSYNSFEITQDLSRMRFVGDWSP